MQRPSTLVSCDGVLEKGLLSLTSIFIFRTMTAAVLGWQSCASTFLKSRIHKAAYAPLRATPRESVYHSLPFLALSASCWLSRFPPVVPLFRASALEQIRCAASKISPCALRQNGQSQATLGPAI